MQRALQLAAERRGFCAPNPAVGAVLVKAGKIIGEGAHWASGQPHAEVMALQALTEAAQGATLFVTLEPCAHRGKTPPCTDSIIRSRIHAVYYGMADPNTQVKGQGAQVLKQAGVACHHLPSAEINDFYRSYCYWLEQRLPWVTVKLAISLDAKIAGADGSPVQLTGAECQRLTHQRRRQSDAILTTAATIKADNPQLNARIGSAVIAKPLYILDSQLSLPIDAQVFQTAESITIFHSQNVPVTKQLQFQQLNARYVAVEADAEGLNLPAILAIIGADGRHDLWVEAGGHCFQAFLNQNLAQSALIYIAPKILGPAATPAFTQPAALNLDLSQVTWNAYGRDAVAQINFCPRHYSFVRVALFS